MVGLVKSYTMYKQLMWLGQWIYLLNIIRCKISRNQFSHFVWSRLYCSTWEDL